MITSGTFTKVFTLIGDTVLLVDTEAYERWRGEGLGDFIRRILQPRLEQTKDLLVREINFVVKEYISRDRGGVPLGIAGEVREALVDLVKVHTADGFHSCVHVEYWVLGNNRSGSGGGHTTVHRFIWEGEDARHPGVALEKAQELSKLDLSETDLGTLDHTHIFMEVVHDGLLERVAME